MVLQHAIESEYRQDLRNLCPQIRMAFIFRTNRLLQNIPKFSKPDQSMTSHQTAAYALFAENLICFMK